MTLKDLMGNLTKLSLSRSRKYSLQFDVSYTDEMTDTELKKLVENGSVYITGLDSEMKLLSERLEKLGLKYSEK